MKDDKKKEEKKEIEIGIIIIVAVILFALIPVAWSTISAVVAPYFKVYSPILASVSGHAFGFLVGLSIPISILLLIGIVDATLGLKHVRKKEEAIHDIKVEMAYDTNVKGDPDLTKKWQSVMMHVDSPNISDWRQAIIQADIILGDILTKAGYHGAGIGEQLKGATKADFNTLDQAWEAHKIRNQIAHEGSDFSLPQHEAKRVINLYKQVFEEFFYI